MDMRHYTFAQTHRPNKDRTLVSVNFKSFRKSRDPRMNCGGPQNNLTVPLKYEYNLTEGERDTDLRKLGNEWTL